MQKALAKAKRPRTVSARGAVAAVSGVMALTRVLYKSVIRRVERFACNQRKRCSILPFPPGWRGASIRSAARPAAKVRRISSNALSEPMPICTQGARLGGQQKLGPTQISKPESCASTSASARSC